MTASTAVAPPETDLTPPATSARRTGGRQYALDGMRALAVVTVICAHAGPAGLRKIIAVTTDPVVTFFVLSSFLITRILRDLRQSIDAQHTTPAHAFRTFYARRFLRIFPVYYFVLAATALLGVPEIVHHWVWHVLYMSNWWIALSGKWSTTAGHLWTLSIEEQFYLVWPLIVLLAPRRVLPYAVMAALICSPLTRYVLFTRTENIPLATRTTFSALDGLAGGALLALLWEHEQAIGRRMMWLRPVALAAAVLGVVATVVVYSQGYLLRYYLTFATCVMTLVGMWLVDVAARGFRGPAHWIFTHPAVVYVGTISYGIYLYHAFVIWGLQRIGLWDRLGKDGSVLGILVVSVITFVIAAASWELLESPLNNLKRYFSYR